MRYSLKYSVQTLTRYSKVESITIENFRCCVKKAQAWNFNFRTWKRKTIPFFPHKHRQCGKNGIVFLFQVRKLKFLACTYTVVTDWEPTKPHLCSKMSLFKISWQILEVQLQLRPLDSSLPYLRPFQWGTVWPYISKGIKNTTGQSWKRLILHNKSQTFKFDLSYFWYPVKYRAIQYLIGKVSDMVNMIQEGSIVTALLASVRTSW